MGSDAVSRGERVLNSYGRAREVTREWQAERTAWVGRRLATHHPDRGPDLWEGAPAAPPMDYPRWSPANLDPLVWGLVVLGILVTLGAVALVLLVRVVRRRWTRRVASA